MFTLSKENRINASIPDQDSLSDAIYINRDGKIQNIKVSVAIQHPYMGDISIKLLSPFGTEVLLQNREGSANDNLNTVFEGAGLEALHGQSTKGSWILTVQDHAAQDDGILDTWGLDLTCNEFESYKSEIFIADSEEEEQLISTQACRFNGRVTKAEAEIELEHPSIGDLIISILAPSGKEIVLRDREETDKKFLFRTWSTVSLKEFVGEPTLGSWTLKIKSFNSDPSGTLKHWKIRFHYESEDDLKVIEGIGPKIESILKAHSIYSYVDLATTPVATLSSILAGSPDIGQYHEPQSWPQQSLLAAQGRWVDLEALKSDLHGGKII